MKTRKKPSAREKINEARKDPAPTEDTPPITSDEEPSEKPVAKKNAGAKANAKGKGKGKAKAKAAR